MYGSYINWGHINNQCRRDSQRRLDKRMEELNRVEHYADSIDKTFIYKRKTKGWEPFTCPCGSSKQLSPSTKRKEFRCSQCGRKIIIEE
ncbi:MAG: hypothetical protein K8S23_16980 [Candidatus Cloacimonetes bacterium]|nr:hypothetical protein [Candidatus Cloacimonadota bacterium]